MTIEIPQDLAQKITDTAANPKTDADAIRQILAELATQVPPQNNANKLPREGGFLRGAFTMSADFANF